MSGSGGGANNTIEENPLPDWAQPSVESYLSRANTLSGDPSAYETYSGTTYASQNQNEIDGILALATRGTNGDPAIDKGVSHLTSIVDGDKINANSMADDSFGKLAEIAIEAFEEEVLPAITISSLRAGRYGGDSFHRLQAKGAKKLMDGFTEVADEHYANDYFNERGIQNRALPANIALGNQDITDAELLHQAGMYEREYDQGLLEDAFRMWVDEQEGTIRRLEIMGNAIRAMVGAQVTKTEPYFRPNEWGAVAGIALAGVGMLANFSGKQMPQTLPEPEQQATAIKTAIDTQYKEM